jgi:hypothetical protein
MYNERPAWLRLAHERLDRAVLDACGWPHDLTDEQILERLLALNLERAGKGAQRHNQERRRYAWGRPRAAAVSLWSTTRAIP